MYKIGELIIYGNHGVCKVEAIGVPDIPGVDKGRTYYTLSPAFGGSKIFTPIDTSVFMRPVISCAQAQKLISLIPSIGEIVCVNQNKKILEDCYQQSLRTHECSELIKVIKTVYIRKNVAADQGKKLGQTDERFMKRAEDLLYGEFAVALSIPKENVKSYIEDRMKELERKIAVSS